MWHVKRQTRQTSAGVSKDVVQSNCPVCPVVIDEKDAKGSIRRSFASFCSKLNREVVSDQFLVPRQGSDLGWGHARPGGRGQCCEHDWSVGDVAPRLAFRLPKHVSYEALRGHLADEISVAERQSETPRRHGHVGNVPHEDRYHVHSTGAKLLLSCEPGDASTRVSGSAGTPPSRGSRTHKSSLDGALVFVAMGDVGA